MQHFSIDQTQQDSNKFDEGYQDGLASYEIGIDGGDLSKFIANWTGAYERLGVQPESPEYMAGLIAGYSACQLLKTRNKILSGSPYELHLMLFSLKIGAIDFKEFLKKAAEWSAAVI